MGVPLIAAVALLAVGFAYRGPVEVGSASSCAPPALGFGAGEGQNAPELPPTVGTLRIAMLFVDFPDSPGDANPDTLFKLYAPRIVAWYRAVSYGKLNIEIQPLAQWLRLPRALSEYETHRFDGAIEAAVASADPVVDFSRSSAIYVVPAMPALASTIIDDVPLRVDGASIHSWAWIATGSLQRLPFVAIHETGHVLGLPDLYRDGVASSQHGWDVMTAAPTGGGLFAWHRWKLGWLDADEVVCMAGRRTITTTLTPIETSGGTKAVISPTGKSAIVVEARARVAEDAPICTAGVLVYRVDFEAGAPENAALRRHPVQLRPARRDDPRRWPRCGKQWRAPLGAGARVTAWNHEVHVLKRLSTGGYRVRVTGPTRAPARHARDHVEPRSAPSRSATTMAT